jgi:hypothetical protein
MEEMDIERAHMNLQTGVLNRQQMSVCAGFVVIGLATLLYSK